MSDDPQLESDYFDPASSLRTSKPSQRGCLSRINGFLWSLFLILLSVTLSVIAIGGFAYFITFGAVPQSPGAFVRIPGELRELRNDNIAFQMEIQTQAAGISAREVRDRELISVIEEEVSELQTLSDDLNEQADISATIQAQAGEDRETMAEIQTMETDFREQMDEIQDRTDRVARFLSRLSELAGDTSIDLDEESPPAEEPSATSGVVTSPIPTATRTARSASPTATAATTASPTSEPTATSAITPTSAETASGAIATSPVETATVYADATPVSETTDETSAAEIPTVSDAEATPQVEPTPEAEKRTYVVQPGDTLRSIAEQFDTTVQELIEANNLSPEEADSLRIGQELIIP